MSPRPKPAYAHSLALRPEREWEPLARHLSEVGELAGEFARCFGLEAHGHTAGIWHDLGKYSAEFQRMIRAASDASLETLPGRVDHSTWGAQHADRRLGASGRLLAYCIAGHHAGLPDAVCPNGSRASLDRRLRNDGIPSVPSPVGEYEGPPPEILDPPQADRQRLQRELRSRPYSAEPDARAFQLSLSCRMLFSALVDADSLCTERFCSPERARTRDAGGPSLDVLARRLRAHVDGLGGGETAVQRARSAVLEACRSKARLPPGFFSLTVPTGGGKTLSSLSFALEHASAHDLRRVVVAIPFTSIIEQNAERIRAAIGPGEDVVLEHHSSLAPERENEWAHMAAENWEAPVVVTTNVQLLESLFAASRGHCRKLHRLARSVIVLDEAQSLPVHVLRPCLSVLRELVATYDCTIVLCTATQPAIKLRRDFPIGLDGVREIVDDVPALFAALRRTRIEVGGPRSDEELVAVLASEPRALCIVNTRAHAAELFTALRGLRPESSFHLSALMCAEHRSHVLDQVHTALAGPGPCRLVSTQVVEAGVDVDFPLVLRAMAGLDSIAQSAGRCNREGRLEELGRVVVFETDRRPSPAVAGAARDAREVLPDHADAPLSPAAIEAYFALHYWKRAQEWDGNGVMDCFRFDSATGAMSASFRDAATRFRVIDDAQKTVVVPYGDGRALVEELSRCERPDRWLLRRLQRFTVNVYGGQLDALSSCGRLLEPHEGLFVLADPEAYDPQTGLRIPEASGHALIA